MSIVVKNQSGDLIGACLNFDAQSEEAEPLCACGAFARNMPENEDDNGAVIVNHESLDVPEEAPMSVVQFLNEVEEPLKRQHLPSGKGQFIYTSMLGTAKNLITAENVQAILTIQLF